VARFLGAAISMTRKALAQENDTPEHQIDNSLLTRKVRITVVGCGSTGSAIACGLPYLQQSMVVDLPPKSARLILRN